MGNCQCLDDNKLPLSQVTIPSKTNQNNTSNSNNINQYKPAVITSLTNQTTKSQRKAILARNGSQINMQQSSFKQKKQPTHEPPSSFASPIATFPKLSQKIMTVDKNLGQFKPTSQICVQQNAQPVLLKSAFKLHNGIIYQGQWHNSKMNGIGQFYLPNGSYIKGFTANNQLVDQVRYIKPNGDYYQGRIKNNKANGQGIKYEKGILYTGKFIDNYLQGQGTEQGPDYTYEGQYHNGSKTFGKLTWGLNDKMPSIYEGGFFDQLFNGQGKLTNQIGQYKGRFQNGKKKGRGEFLWKTGEKFQGIYDNNMKNGNGKIYNSNKMMILQGTWKNDKFVPQPT